LAGGREGRKERGRERERRGEERKIEFIGLYATKNLRVNQFNTVAGYKINIQNQKKKRKNAGRNFCQSLINVHVISIFQTSQLDQCYNTKNILNGAFKETWYG
jgi:hypothetical protein